MDNINGGYPPIKLLTEKNKKENKKNEFTKERFFKPEINNLDIKNILDIKKQEIVKNEDDNIEIIDSL